MHSPREAPTLTRIAQRRGRLPVVDGITRRRAALFIAGGCNLACDYCYIHEDAGVMSDATARAVLDFLFDQPPPHVNVGFFGKEPLLARRLLRDMTLRALHLARERQVVVDFNLNTNGTLLDGDTVAFLADHQFRVSLSVDAGREAHDRHRLDRQGRGTYDAVLPWIERLQAAGVETHVRVTYTADTITALPAALAGLARAGARSVAISAALEAPGWDAQAHARAAAQFEPLFRAYVALKRDFPHLHLADFENTDELAALADRAAAGDGAGQDAVRTPCGAASELIAVDTSGRIYPCYRDAPGGHHAIGDVFQGFARGAATVARARVTEPLPECATCAVRALCRRCPPAMDAAGAVVFCGHQRAVLPARLAAWAGIMQNHRQTLPGAFAPQRDRSDMETTFKQNGKVYKIPAEVLKQFELTPEEAKKALEQKPATYDAPEKGEGLWYELGESDCF